MTSRYREIMRRQVCGHTPAQIKRDLDMSDSNFFIVTSSELYVEEKKKMEVEIEKGVIKKLGEGRALDPVNQILQDAAENAAHTNVDLMMTGSEKVKQLSAWDILNRRGYKPIEHMVMDGEFRLKGVAADHINKALEDLGDNKKGGK